MPDTKVKHPYFVGMVVSYPDDRVDHAGVGIVTHISDVPHKHATEDYSFLWIEVRHTDTGKKSVWPSNRLAPRYVIPKQKPHEVDARLVIESKEVLCKHDSRPVMATSVIFHYAPNPDTICEFTLFCEIGEPYKKVFVELLRQRGLVTCEIELEHSPWFITSLYRPDQRCGKCDNCEFVSTSSKLLMPNPPFTHASDLDVRTWNQILFSNPCRTWELGAAHSYEDTNCGKEE